MDIVEMMPARSDQWVGYVYWRDEAEYFTVEPVSYFVRADGGLPLPVGLSHSGFCTTPDDLERHFAGSQWELLLDPDDCGKTPQALAQAYLMLGPCDECEERAVYNDDGLPAIHEWTLEHLLDCRSLLRRQRRADE